MNNIGKIGFKTPYFINENIEKLAALFPQCVNKSTKGEKIDFNLLQQKLSHDVVKGSRERYRLEWPDKREAIIAANLFSTKTCAPCSSPASTKALTKILQRTLPKVNPCVSFSATVALQATPQKSMYNNYSDNSVRTWK